MGKGYLCLKQKALPARQRALLSIRDIASLQVLQGAHEELSRYLPLQPWSAVWPHAKASQPLAATPPAKGLPLPESVAQHAAHALLSILDSLQLRYSATTRQFTQRSAIPGDSSPDCLGERQLRALLHVAGARRYTAPPCPEEANRFQLCMSL